ncbi:MAG: DUF4139 domain-containing protein [Acidobacteria bacterium]|nr:DUF4139 domain-containing protein [Acidobacteriota bacterium]
MNDANKAEPTQAQANNNSTLDDQKSVAITVYNSNIGLVKDTRTLKMPRGTSQLRFMDVAQQINPTTVHIKSLTAPNALSVVEQSYEYDLLNPAKLLDKYVGREVTLVLRSFENNSEKLTPTRATLLSNNSGQVWQIGNQIVINPTNIVETRFDQLPSDLIAKPTLVWTLNNTAADSHTVEASYLTNGIGWRSDYVVVVNKDDTKADLNGWVTINNNSGTTYKNAELKLVAGDVNRVREDVQTYAMKTARMAEAAPAAAPQFQEQAFFEYHLYTLQRPATLKNNETKQINLLSAANFAVKKELVLNGQQYYYQGYNNPGEPIKEKVGVYVEFKNGKENGLGQPLPAGVVRVYKADAEGAQQFIGENRIDHTPKDERVKIKLGDAFDVVAERKQTDYKAISRRVFEYAYEIRIRNHKEEAVNVVVNEPIGGDWEMVNSTFPAEKTAAFAARFNVPVAKDGEAVLSYRVRVKF